MASFMYKIPFLRSGKSYQKCKEELPIISDSHKNKKDMLTKVYKVLIWDDPLISSFYVICVSIVFWLIIYLDFKVYGIIFLAILVITIEQLWIGQENLDSQNLNTSTKCTLASSRSRRVSNVDEVLKNVQEILYSMYYKAKFLRQTQPGKFCLYTCTCFLLLSVIGRLISGIASFYVLLMLIMTTPGIASHFFQPNVICRIYNFFISSHKDGDIENNDEMEVFLPETNQETLEILRLAGELQSSNKTDETDDDSNDLLLEHISSRTNDTSDSLCSKISLYPDFPLMPSPENSMDFLDLDDTLVSHLGINNTTKENDSINFENKHFDGDSTDEEEFVKGLKFTDDKNINSNLPESKFNSEILLALGSKFLTLNKKSSDKNVKDSSSDTDSFEMISEGDV